MSDVISGDAPGLFDWAPAPPRGQGRPEYVWTAEKSREIMALLAAGRSQKIVLAVAGCDAKTFRKVFSREWASRHFADLVLRSKLMGIYLARAGEGDVAAGREFNKMLHTEQMKVAAERMGSAPKVSPPPKGLKVQRKDAAYDAGKTDDSWGPLLHGDVGQGLPN